MFEYFYLRSVAQCLQWLQFVDDDFRFSLATIY